jgi:hypothetical protein
MNRKALILIFILLILFAGAGVFAKNDTKQQPVKQVEGKLFVIVDVGKYWKSEMRIMHTLKIAKNPQMAIWLEDMNGKFQATVFVTKRTAFQDWRAMPFEKKETIKRPSSLPVWTNIHVSAGVHPIETCSACHDVQKSKEKTKWNRQILDAFTGATPQENFIREWKIPPGLKQGKYIVCVEVNQSYDYNDKYKKGLPEGDANFNGVSGQPSFIYKGIIDLTHASSITLNPVGHGEPSGKNGEITENIDGITTAAGIIINIQIKYLPAF